MKNFSQKKMTNEELSKIKGGRVTTERYLCAQNNTISYYFYNNESGAWYNLLGSRVDPCTLVNCSQECVPE